MREKGRPESVARIPEVELGAVWRWIGGPRRWGIRSKNSKRFNMEWQHKRWNSREVSWVGNLLRNSNTNKEWPKMSGKIQYTLLLDDFQSTSGEVLPAFRNFLCSSFRTYLQCQNVAVLERIAPDTSFRPRDIITLQTQSSQTQTVRINIPW